MRKILLLAAILAVFMLVACESEPPDTNFVNDVPSLGAIWEPYFPLGNIVAVQHRNDLTNARRIAVLRRHFEIITAENAMKPAYVQPFRNNFDFRNSNIVINFARANGMRVHGHTLVWHGARPGQDLRWMGGITDRNEKLRILRDHVTRVVRELGDNVESWCVVNEALTSGGGRRQGATEPQGDWRAHLRDTSWFEIIGYTFIEEAFIAARNANPNLILYYNDYNLYQPAKRDAAYNMVRDINTRHPNVQGRPLIDAVGMQGHYHRGRITEDDTPYYIWGPSSINNIRAAVERFISLDLEHGVSITELDVTVGNIGRFTAGHERAQAIMYAQIFQILRANSANIRRVSIWGIDDEASWRRNGNPLLFRNNFRPKEAFWAVARPEAFVNEQGLALPASEINDFLRQVRENPRAVFTNDNHW